ncbi:ABC-type Na+ efflux pump, permease component [Lachnospiraceae bacterium XBB1006]|nr:ABC-type Na+ efflux pump, permease component [Lachnospiraceae bacterium XBB1006]
MNNFSILYRIEIKKILSKKSVWIMLVLGMVLIIVSELSNILPLNQNYTYPDGSSMTPAQFYHKERKTCEELSGKRLDDAFLKKMREDIRNFLKGKEYIHYRDSDAGKYQGVWYAAEKLGYENIISLLYNQYGEEKFPIDCLMEDSAKQYYRRMRENLETEFAQSGLTEKESEYWRQKADQLKKPITYEYAHGIQTFLQMDSPLIWFAFLLIVVSLAGVFSEETVHRTDAMILSTKNGREPVCAAKLLAGATVAVVEMGIVLGGNFGAVLLTFGSKGLRGALMLVVQNTPWDITIGQALKLSFGFSMILAILFALVTMFLSQRLNNSLSVMAVQVGVLLVGIFSIPASYGILSQIWSLRPTAFSLRSFLAEYRLVELGGRLFNAFQVAGVLYVAGSLLIVPIVFLGYKKMQIEKNF